MNWLKDEFQKTTSGEKRMKILTLSPLSISHTMQFFNTTKYMVNKSRYLRKEYGILPEIPKVSKGKILTGDIIAEVENFYQCDDVSRICPGKSDFLSVRDKDGNKIHMQKRLLLGNLKELYELYKEETRGTPKVSFSSFASLQPKHCVIAGASGTHSICICTYHQNPKLMISAIGHKDVTIYNLLAKCVCNVNVAQCMLQQCRKCPGVNGVSEFLRLELEGDNREYITFNQWTQTDRSTLETMSLSIDEYIDKLSNKIRILTKHHFIAKRQGKYLKGLKETINESEGIIIGDFSENYSFVVQDASQAFHWTNNQATIHPFLFYYKSNNILSHKTYCFISDCMEHKTSLVYTFQTSLITDLKKNLPTLKKIHYFTDGSIAQYKNKYNFINLCHHAADFDEIVPEWNFFATSHGKNVCDGIGGMVKRAASKASLQRISSQYILTAQDLFTFAEGTFPTIKFYYVSKENFKNKEQFLQERFQRASTVKGTHGFHKVKPLSNNTILAFQTSESNTFQTFTFCEGTEREGTAKVIRVDEQTSSSGIENIIGEYVACLYNNKV